MPAGPTDQWLYDRQSSLSILMPVYNERETVKAAIEQVLTTPLPVESIELIVIDDGSTDGTGAVLDSLYWPPGVILLRHDSNAGKGADRPVPLSAPAREGLCHRAGDHRSPAALR